MVRTDNRSHHFFVEKECIYLIATQTASTFAGGIILFLPCIFPK